MAIVNADRVRENTTTTGSGALILLGAVRTFRTFLDGVGNGNQCYYAIVHNTLNEWEVGLGTVASGGSALARNVVYSSSNGNALVDFSAGTKQIAVIYPGTQIDTVASNVGLAAGYAAAASSDATLASIAAQFALVYRTSASAYATQAAISEANALVYKTSASAFSTDAQTYAAQASAYATSAGVESSLAGVYRADASAYAAQASVSKEAASAAASLAQYYASLASAAVINVSAAQAAASLAFVYKASASAFATQAGAFSSSADQSASLANIYKISASAYVTETAANASLAYIYMVSASSYATQAKDSASLAAYYASLLDPTSFAKLSATQILTGANTFTSALTINTSVSVSGTTNFADSEVLRAKFRDYALTHNALATVSAGVTLDLTVANYFSMQVAGSCSIAFTNPPASPNAGGFILEMTNGGGFTLSWPAAVKWPGGTPPTFTTSGVDVLVFITDDGGTTWRGVQSMADSK